MHFNLFALHLTFKNGENCIIIMEINIRKTLNNLRSRKDMKTAGMNQTIKIPATKNTIQKGDPFWIIEKFEKYT